MTDWLMVIITFIYVVATIFICVFNYRSAKAAKEQIEVSKTQYKEDSRLKMLPCLLVEKIEPTSEIKGTIEICLDGVSKGSNDEATICKDVFFKITNVGCGIAKEIQYSLCRPITNYTKYRILSLPINDSRTVKLSLKDIVPDEISHRREVLLRISYTDLLDHEYVQLLTVYLISSCEDISMETFYITAPKYISDDANRKEK